MLPRHEAEKFWTDPYSGIIVNPSTDRSRIEQYREMQVEALSLSIRMETLGRTDESLQFAEAEKILANRLNELLESEPTRLRNPDYENTVRIGIPRSPRLRAYYATPK